MPPFSRPEAVLKQAEHLITVHQQPAALQLLSELFTMKKFRSTALSALEPIVLRFVQLCVDMRKGRIAKEGLMQYKNIAQNSSVTSVETVVKKFLQISEEKLEEARKEADRLYEEKLAAKEVEKEQEGGEKEEVEDLEASETPERVLMLAILGTGQESRERMDRALVTPWLRFLWEAYRTALETLKNNARLEIIYQQVAQMAFNFCLQHQRKTEFRRLCDLLRLHLTAASKYAHQPHAINLSDPETLQRHLDTRFVQLDAAIEMELWGEAFRSVEDVHHLLTLTSTVGVPGGAGAAKKPANLKQLSLYYEKLTRVFSPSAASTISSADTSLFHAAAYARYFATLRSLPSNGGKTTEELEHIAGGVVLSALCVREESLESKNSQGLTGGDVDSEDVKRGGRDFRLATLLGLNTLPTRRGMLKEAEQKGILSLCPEPIHQLHTLLTTPLSPHTLAKDSLPVLSQLAEPKFSTYAAYMPHLPQTLLTHLLLSLSETYSEIYLQSLWSMTAPWEGTQWGVSREAAEGWLMALCRRGVLKGRVDHGRGVVLFSEDEGENGDELRDVALRLQRALVFVEEPLKVEDHASPVYQALQAALAALPTTRAALIHKRALAQRRQELSAEMAARKTKEEQQSKLDHARAEKEEAEKREREAAKTKEQERVRREIESVRKGEQQKIVQDLIAKGNIKVNVDDIENLDTQKLVQLQVEQIEKQKKEVNDRLRIIAKRLDHTERAFRKEERPLLEEDYTRQQEEDRITFYQTQDETKKRLRHQFEEELSSKARLGRMMPDYLAMRSEIEGEKRKEFEARREVAERKRLEERRKRREEVLRAREEERKAVEEEERRIREEEERRIREEEEREREEEARLREEEEKAAAATVAKLKRSEEREREIAAARKRVEEEEARERAREERRRASHAAPPAVPAAAEPVAAWRRGGPRGTPSGTATPPREAPIPAAPLMSAGDRAPDGRRRLNLAPRTIPRPETPSAPSSPIPAPVPPAPTPERKGDTNVDDDGFTTVTREKAAVWSRGMGRRGRGGLGRGGA
ncbi:hypothetical protein DACRYDRAFT_24618 [Dacryopinax primogenitus]|uniref:Eukaryotic translation initiation factor 3 subunit A n=1 Tax=Dacryopinax primogenitus (strain DJM 731) TaxID=1858805 RepID=M5FX79_DACPD|nr:uncharacterized protein DACRYDRAFT_24618 [Dacryopinax primogenitus]EJT98081.1 hypothetical protein DACRYDRAFT_24618 [Dacryopinax primogenitus]